MKSIVYFSMFTLLAACGAKSSGSSQNDQIPPVEDPFAKLMHIEPKGKTYPESEKMDIAFAVLKARCLESGNYFSEADKLCECPISDVPVSFSLKTASEKSKEVAASCVRHEMEIPGNGYDSFAELLSGDREKFINTISYMGGDLNRLVANFEFHLAEKQQDKAYEQIATALDEQPLYLKNGPRFKWFGSYDIHVGWEYPDSSDYNQLASLVKSTAKFHGFPGRTRLERKGIKLLGFITNPANFSRVLSAPIEGRKGWDFAVPDSNDDNFKELSDLRAATAVVNSLLRGEIDRLPDQKDRVIIVEDGCHLRCITTTEFSAVGAKFRYEKLYVYGEIVATRISRFTGDTYFAGMSFSSSVLFGQGKLPAIVTVNRKFTEGLKAGWQVDVYGETIRKVKSFSENHIDDESLLKSHLELTHGSVENSAPIIMMDEIVDYRDKYLMSFIKKGPFRTTSYVKGGSVFGWFDAVPGNRRGNNYAEYYDGLLDLSYAAHKGNEYHSSFVGRLIAGIPHNTGETSIIPMSKFASFANPRVFNDVITMSRARVVNQSHILVIDGKKTCPLNNYHFDKRAIWVSGAGNDGLENPADGCYQNMTPIHRRIVVAANYEGSTRLTDYSDRGRYYADISASGIAYDRHGKKSEGTSYAAPRVSQTAGMLFKRYGDKLSNQLIRLAILLSAKVDVYERSDTRTGGALNREGALRAGQYMHDVLSGKARLPKDLTKRNLMYRIIEASGTLNEEDQISDQVEWLIEGGI